MNIDHFLEDIRHYAAPVEVAKILHGLNDDDVNGLKEEINQAESDCKATLIKLANKASKQTTTQNDIDPQIADAESEMWLIRTIRDAAEIYPEAATWLLERRFSERYSNWQKVQSEVRKELKALFLHLEASLPPELFNAVVEASGGLRTESGDGLD